MSRRLMVLIILAFIGMASNANAMSVCETFGAMSEVEDESRRFLGASSYSQRRDSLDRMAGMLRPIENLDLSSPAFDGIRGAVVDFIHSRQRILHQAENFGIELAITAARTQSYAGYAGALEAAYRPFRCNSPGQAPNHNDVDGTSITKADVNEVSARDGFGLSIPVLLYWLMAASVVGAVCLRVFLEAKARKKRRSKRFNCAINTSIRKDGWQYEACLHDISQVGCKLQSDKKLVAGDRLEITLLKTRHQGRVIWSNRHFTGIEFFKHLTAAQVDDALAAKPEKARPRVLGQGAHRST